MRHKKARPAEFAGEWRWLKKIAGGFGHAILIISSERFWRRLAARFVAVLEQLTLGASPVLERISGRTTAPKKSGRRARRSLPLSDGSRLCAASLLLAKNFSPSWAYPLLSFDYALHVTTDGKPSLQNSWES